jgi:glucokinase
MRRTQPCIVGLDIGGTKTAAGLVDRRGRLFASLVEPTRPGSKAGMRQIFGLLERLIRRAGKGNVMGIGICAPGPLDARRGVVLNPPNLAGWRNVPLVRLVEKRFGLPARVENDANAAGLAEALFGAARRYRDIFYVTLSTGIGTGIIIDKKIYRGKNGAAGEGGHVVIDYHSPWICGCGTRGCIEALASGPAMVRRTRALLKKDPSTPSLLRKRRRLDPPIIAAAARRGDRVAKAIIDETGFLVGVWLGSIVSLLDPEAIVIGGGVAQIGRPLFAKIRATLPHFTINRRFARRLPVLPAKLQKNVGIYGAASLFL